MSSTVDPGAAPRLHAELQALRLDVDAVRQELTALAAENASLRTQLERSEAARTDLFAQSRHLLDLLAESRREVWHLQSRAPS